MYHNHCYYDPEVVHNKFTYHGLSDNHLANSYCGRLCTPHRLISLIVYIIGTNVYCTNGIPRLDAAAIFLATRLCAATIRGRCLFIGRCTSYDVIEHDAKWIPSPFQRNIKPTENIATSFSRGGCGSTTRCESRSSLVVD